MYVNVIVYVPCDENVCDGTAAESTTSAVPAVPDWATPTYVTVAPAGTSNVACAVIALEEFGADHVNCFRAYAGEPPDTSPVADPDVPGSAVNRHAYAARCPYAVANASRVAFTLIATHNLP
ncbi:MAG: hypothetical protein IRZ06_10190 [Nevskia sp.]|nr:hypothetical protein [Nevskia sp.]